MDRVRLTQEGKEDGIYIVDGYLAIPCEICGHTLFRTEYSRKRQYICDKCKKKVKAMTQADIVALTTPQPRFEKYETRFSKAVEAIEDQVIDFSLYKDAIKAAYTRMDEYGSIPEAMAAIELLRYNLRIIPQQQVGRYKVDFCLPDIKVLLEVDGKLYHKSAEQALLRDMDLLQTIGYDWNVFHVLAEEITEDVTSVIRPLRQYIKALSSQK